VITIAAVGDVHAGVDTAGVLRPHLRGLPEEADLFLLAGDLTKTGDPREAEVLAGELADLGVPIVAVLGNHDHHSDRPVEVRRVLGDAGVRVLEGETESIRIGEVTVGVVGAKGFGGGFEGACATDFGEPETKAFIRHSQERAAAVERELKLLDADVRIVLLHYSPVRETLLGEQPELYPFLGSYLLAEACDRQGADLILHGHAHHGTEKGITPGGIGVRNVAQPVLRRPYAVYAFDGATDAGGGRVGSDAGHHEPGSRRSAARLAG
jgi:Icc-related predicted phosphoesterase